MGFGRMDALEALEDDLSGSDAEKEEEEEEAEAAAPATKSAKIDYETLQKAGYKGGPSVLFVPEKKEESEGNWNWGTGNRRGDNEVETAAEREATRIAAEAAMTAELAMRSAAQQQQLRDAKHAENLQLRDAARAQNAAAHAAGGRGGRGGRGDKKGDKDYLSFNQREKRKRERGQAAGGKDWVQEEKRIQRQYGITSGFDM